VQIPKAQKDTDDLTVFLRFWDLHVNMLVKLTPALFVTTVHSYLSVRHSLQIATTENIFVINL